jgi:hypothetical protein
MTRITDLCHPETVRVAAAHQAEAEKIAAELAAIAATGMVLPGSVTQRRTRCGRRNCGCHADPPRLHGPYWQWTRKVAAKTICRWLSDGQHRDYTPWIDNDRRLRELLTRLEALGAAAFDADPRWERQASRRPAEPEPESPDSVGSARLTRGRPSIQAPFAQLSPKREDLAKAQVRALLRQVLACQVIENPPESLSGFDPMPLLDPSMDVATTSTLGLMVSRSWLSTVQTADP